MFVDFLLEKGVLLLEHYNFLNSKKNMTSEYGYKEEDIIAFLEVLPEEDVVNLYNEYVGRIEYNVCPKIESNVKEIYDSVFKQNNIVDAIPIKTKDGELIVATLTASDDIKRSLSVRVRNYSVTTIKVLKYKFEVYKEVLDIDFKNAYHKEITPSDILALMVIDAIELRATDIHMVVETREVKGDLVPTYPVYFRIGTDMVKWDRMELEARTNQSVSNAFVSKSRANFSDANTPDGVSSKIEDILGDSKWGARIQCNACLDGFETVIRIHDNKKRALLTRKLGFTDENAIRLENAAIKDTGFTLVTGPMGSGKNVTIYSMLYYRMQKFISAVKEYSSPVEVRMPYPQYDYADNIDALYAYVKACKKTDTDMAFVGEIPNNEVGLAIKDLVNSSIHVIASTHIERGWFSAQKLYGIYGEDYLNLFSQVNAIITQKMFTRVCPLCSLEVTYEELNFKDKRLYRKLGLKDNVRIVNPDADQVCDCFHGMEKGGLNPTVEILEITDEIVNNILELKTPILVEKYLKEYMYKNRLAMEFSVRQLLMDGKITLSQVYKREVTTDITKYL